MRVLIVDDEVNLRYAIERRLRKAGMETGSASTVRHAIDRLRAEPYDVVLCDLRMPGGNGTQLLQWLGSYSPSTMIIVVSAFVTPEFRKTYRPTGRLRILEKPVDLDVLVDTLEELGPRKGFYGNAIEVELFDYVQMIALSGRDKLVEVTTPAGKGLIWFEHGDIVHVEYDQFRGEMAFYKLLAVNRGAFKEVFNREPPMRTVVRSSTHLLMEAARRADEGLLVEDAPATDEDDETSFGDVASELDAEHGEAQPVAAGEDPFAEPGLEEDPFAGSEMLAESEAESESEAEAESESGVEAESDVGVEVAAVAEPMPRDDASEEIELSMGFDEPEELDVEIPTELDLDEPTPGRELTFHASSPAGLPVVDDDDLVDPFEGTDDELETITGRHSALPQPPPVPHSRLPKPKPKPEPGVPEVVLRQGSFTEEEKAVLAGLSEEPAPASGAAGMMGHAAMFEDPDMRQVMLEQFWQFEGINGVAIISSTGKVLAEDMRNNSALVTLAGFYMRGAARIARTLGFNVFDGVVARSIAGSQLVMVSMGAASAVLSVETGTDPEAVRDAVMGVE